MCCPTRRCRTAHPVGPSPSGGPTAQHGASGRAAVGSGPQARSDLRGGCRADAGTGLRALPEPPADLLYEALCCLQAAVALELGDRSVLTTVRARLLPASGQLAGAGSGLVTLGPVDHWLTAIDTALA
ncbi:hypothetical protein [Streptomyces bullii]|uniref:Uncharacterized protein n=1 Tax=Streptomyces bullii TaxID=349910 RepID=A0ABW0UPL5_9ACTN